MGSKTRLDEAQIAFNKVGKTIFSCRTEEHFNSVEKYIELYDLQFHVPLWDPDPLSDVGMLKNFSYLLRSYLRGQRRKYGFILHVL